MIIVTLVFKKDLQTVLLKLDEHHTFLEQYRANGFIVASGPTEDKKEGIIIVKSDLVNEVEKIMEQDPFYLYEIADYKYKLFFDNS
ncbi:YciI family protein [Acinetobacter pittii]|uniref:YciI family protein n=1 Tax=Acinetobacter pittii TaxID=48296 RepID=UPI0032605B7D